MSSDEEKVATAVSDTPVDAASPSPEPGLGATSPAPAAAEPAEPAAAAASAAAAVDDATAQQLQQANSLRSTNADLQKRVDDLTAELTQLRASASTAAATAAASGAADDAALKQQLADKDAEIKKLKRELDDTTARLDISNGRLKMVEERANKQKEDEVNAIKEEAQATLAKRKAQFLALREQYQVAATRIQEFEATITDNQTKLADQATIIADLKAQIASREEEFNTIKSNESSLLQRITTLETSVDEEKALAAASQANLAAAEKELGAAKNKLDQLDEKASSARPTKCSIVLEQPGADAPPAIFPTVVETGRVLVFKWQMPGKVQIRWARSFRGGAWTPIEGKSAMNPRYVPTVDDIGACLRATATAIEGGETLSAEIGPVHAGIALVSALSENIKKFDVTLNCDIASEVPGSRQRQLQLNKEKIKLRSGGKTVIKAAWGDNVRCSLEPDLSSKFSVTFEDARVSHSFLAPNQLVRDIIVATIRSFNFQLMRGGKMTSASDHLQAVALQLIVLNETMILGTPGSAAAEPRRPSLANAAATGSTRSLAAGAPRVPATPTSAAGAAAAGLKKDQSASALSLAETPKAGANGGGGGGGSPPSTPRVGAAAAANAASFDFDDFGSPSNGGGPQRKDSQIPSRTESGGDRKVSAADAGGAPSLASPSSAATGAGAVSSTSSLAPPAEPKPVRKNSAGDEVDAEGFVIRKNARGFDDIAPPADSDDEDGESKGPVIKVSIRNEARPMASGESLRNLTAGLSLGGPGKGGKKGKGTLGKEKKKGRKSEGGGLAVDGAEDGAGAGGAVGDDLMSGFLAASKPSGGDAGGADGGAGAGAGAGAAVDPLFDLLGSASAAPSAPSPSNAAPMIDLFSGLDTPSSAAPSSSSSSSSSSSATIDLFASLSPTSAAAAAAATVPVTFEVIESVNLVCEAGKIVQISIVGEVHVSLASDSSSSPSSSQSLVFQLANASRIDKIQPLENCAVVDAGAHSYTLTFPSGVTKFQALRYKLKPDASAAVAGAAAHAVRDVPVSIVPSWTFDGSRCVLSASCTPNPSFPLAVSGAGSSFSQLRLVTNLEVPAVLAVKSSSLPCKSSPDKHKLMWALPNVLLGPQPLDAEIELDASQGVTSAKPLQLSFVLEHARAPLGGFLVKPTPTSSLAVSAQSTTIKSGATCTFS